MKVFRKKTPDNVQDSRDFKTFIDIIKRLEKGSMEPKKEEPADASTGSFAVLEEATKEAPVKIG